MEASDRLLGAFTPAVSTFAKQALEKQGAHVMCDTFVTGADDHSVSFKGAKDKKQDKQDYGLLVWAGGIGARPITKQLGATLLL